MNRFFYEILSLVNLNEKPGKATKIIFPKIKNKLILMRKYSGGFTVRGSYVPPNYRVRSDTLINNQLNRPRDYYSYFNQYSKSVYDQLKKMPFFIERNFENSRDSLKEFPSFNFNDKYIFYLELNRKGNYNEIFWYRKSIDNQGPLEHIPFSTVISECDDESLYDALISNLDLFM